MDKLAKPVKKHKDLKFSKKLDQQEFLDLAKAVELEALEK